MNYNNYYKDKDIILIPRNSDKPIFKNNIDMKQLGGTQLLRGYAPKPKNNTYENIREIVLDKKENDINKNIIKSNKINLKQNIIYFFF